MNNDNLFIDLKDIDLSEVEILTQEGSRGMEYFAASTGTNCDSANACSCSIDEDDL
jgi:hypothetical protein